MSVDVLEQIIAAIFDRTPIWNSKDVNHKNRRVINQLWEEIKNEVDIEVTDLKKKWKNIKDHYRKKLKKMPAPRSGDAGQVHQPSHWQYFAQLSFLQDEILPTLTEGNLNSTEITNQISNDYIEIEDISEENVQENTTGHDEKAFYSQQASTSSQEASTSSQEACSSSQQASISSRETSTSQRSRKKKTANDIRTEFLELERKRIRLLENDLSNQSRNEVSRHENKSDDYYFFMSLLPQMEKFMTVQKFRVRQKINQAILDELSVDVSMYTSNEP